MAKVRCPKCHGNLTWKLSDGRRKCRRCYCFFRPRLTKFRLSWYQMNHLIEYFCLGVPALRIRQVLPLSRPTIEKFFRFLRQLIYDETTKELKEATLAGELEVDEALFGGQRAGKRGWGSAGKHMVFGIYQRDGHVLTFPISSRGYDTLAPLIERYTIKGSFYYRDDWHAYAWLPIRGNHVVVRKEKGKPLGSNHLNGLEGFWSYAKHWLYQYRGVPKQYFHLYLKEVEWRFNHRHQRLLLAIKKLVKQQIGADN